MTILTYLLAILPGLIICGLIIYLDRFEREKAVIPLILCFVLGMLVTFPAMFLQAWAAELGMEDPTNFWKLLFLSFILVALIEELVKFAGLLAYPFQTHFFSEPLDGIVYAIMIGMGFATLENVYYANYFGIETVAFRAFTAVPAHAVFAIITGYYAGLAKFNKVQRWSLLAKGFIIAVLIHGVYDFFILQEYREWMMAFSTLVLFVSLYFAIKMFKKHRELSRLQTMHAEENDETEFPEKNLIP